MATLTLEYDAQNTLARKTLDYILSLGVFRKKEQSQSPTLLADEFRAAIQEVRNADAGQVQLMDANDLLNEL